MFIQRMFQDKSVRIMAVVFLLFATLLSFTMSPVQAGKEGVFISQNVYFALDEATVSTGTEVKTLYFGVELVNGSNQTVDFNKFGVRVVDNSGNIYNAQLTETSIARVRSNQSSIFRYAAQLPLDVSIEQVKVNIFMWDYSSSSFLTEIGSLSVSNVLKSTPIQIATVNITSPVGELALSYKSTYRLLSETSDDVIVSEIVVQNTDTRVISLPTATTFYGGHVIDDFDLQGKVIRLQSSPYLNPGQQTTVYVYTKIPYNTPVRNGYVYLGNGTYNSQSAVWTTKNEWTQFPFNSLINNNQQTSLQTEWTIKDLSRMSTAKIVESKAYDMGNQKTIAIRIVQTNNEVRNGANVPYIGYITDGKGSVWALKPTEDVGKLSKNSQALTTLWATIPSSAYADGDLKVVFGQKVDDIAFTSVQEFDFSVSPESGTASSNNLINMSLYPYNLSMLNSTWRAIGAGTIEVSFDYTQSKTADMTGIAKNRGLQFALIDTNGNVISKTLDYSIEGTSTVGTTTVSPLTIGSRNKLSFSGLTTEQLMAYLSTPRVGVFEKFEGGTRLIGVISF